MHSIVKLPYTLDRFNQGCSFFQKAVDSWKSGDMQGYETALRKSATETIGALEWALKIYLRNLCRDRIMPDDRLKLKQPNFNDLITLMKTYADPPLKAEDISLLYDYRDSFRNAAEHDASVPPSYELYNAIQKVRCIILIYLPVQEGELRIPSLAITPEGAIQDLKAEYFETLRSRYEYMDLGGISPRVGSKVIKIRMKDLFIPLQAREEETLFEPVLEESDPARSSKSSDNFSVSSGGTMSEEKNAITETDSFDLEGTLQTRYRRAKARSIGINSVLEKQKVVVLGHPGSGKTTVGKYITYSIVTKKIDLIGKHLEHHIPVVIRAAEYAASLKMDPTLSFYDYVIQEHTSKFGKLFEWALQRGLCLLIIDGLDEIPDSQSRIMTSRRIEGFVSEFQRNRFLVTSRIVGYRQNQLSGDFAHVMLSELSEEQVLQFLEQWYMAIESETDQPIDEDEINSRASSLWKAIESNPGISKLAGNPLLLTIIALANWRGTRLPSRRVELYQIATETLVENWPLKQRGVTLDLDEILAILEPIAYKIFSSGSNNMITERAKAAFRITGMRSTRNIDC